MDGRLLMIVLRLVHILSGVFWVGALLVAAGFLYPAAQDGPEGGRMLQRIMVRHRLATWVSAAAGLTMLSGLWMYGRVAMATGGAWMRTRPGIALGVGGLLAITAAGIAGAVLAPGGRQLSELGTRLHAGGGGALSGDGPAEMRRLQARLMGTTRLVAALLVLAAAAMAVARYL